MAVRFRGTVKLVGKTATFIAVPDDVVERLGAGRRPPVTATINGHSFRSTVAPMSGTFYLPLNRGNREASGVRAGQKVMISLEHDPEPRPVVVPSELEAALKHARLWGAFASLPLSHRREHAQYVAEAKKPETRARRAQRCLGMIEAVLVERAGQPIVAHIDE